MKISAPAVFLTLVLQAISLLECSVNATAAQAGPSRTALPETTPQNSPNPTPSSSEPAPIIIPVPAPRQPTISPAIGSPPTQISTPPTTPKSAAEIVSLARSWKGTPYRYAGDSRRGIDCSHFVFSIYSQAVPGFGYRMAREYLNDSKFAVVANPQAGDIIVFPRYRGSDDHVGIVTDPQSKMFIGSQTSTGVAETSYGPNTYYWGKRPYKIVRLK
jgi:cell wall-associated NlpC family hydrolase